MGMFELHPGRFESFRGPEKKTESKLKASHVAQWLSTENFLGMIVAIKLTNADFYFRLLINPKNI